MTPEERAARLEIPWNGTVARGPVARLDDAELRRRIAQAIRDAVQEERKNNVAVMREYLQFNSQRAVSWHEVEDCIAEILKRGKL